MDQTFEQRCKENLLACAVAFASKRKMKLTTLGRKVANDSPFFARLNDESRTFTARKYDEVIGWFSHNWPDDLDWPRAVRRPNAPKIASSGDTAAHAAGSSTDPSVQIPQSRSAGAVKRGGAVASGDTSSCHSHSATAPEGAKFS